MSSLPVFTTRDCSDEKLIQFNPGWCQTKRTRQVHRMNDGVRFGKLVKPFDEPQTIEHESGEVYNIVGRTEDSRFVVSRNHRGVETFYTVPEDGVSSVYSIKRKLIPYSGLSSYKILGKNLDGNYDLEDILHGCICTTTFDLSKEKIKEIDERLSRGLIYTGMVVLTRKTHEKDMIRGGIVPQPVIVC